jgi:hypothetical protein
MGVAGYMYFDASQISLATRAFDQAEKMAARHYRLSGDQLKGLRYDVKTLAHLDQHEINEHAFAHLCRYHYRTERSAEDETGFYFYRICLQDDRILDAVERTSAFIKLPPLLLYIAAHEIVHVIRFVAGDENFEASPAEKDQEEQRVRAITGEMLSSISFPDLKIVMDCFSDRHRLGDLLN